MFGLNRQLLLRGRRNAWAILKQLLPRYAQLRSAGREADAEEIVCIFRDAPFSGVLAAFLRIAQGPSAHRLIPPECLAVLTAHPEIATWL